jgi:hypothetical protein
LTNRVRRLTGGRDFYKFRKKETESSNKFSTLPLAIKASCQQIVVILLAALQGLSERRLRSLFLYFFTTHQSGVNGLRKKFVRGGKDYGKRIRDSDRADFIAPGQRYHSLEKTVDQQGPFSS